MISPSTAVVPSAVFAREVDYTDQPADRARELMLAGGLSAWKAGGNLELFDWIGDLPGDAQLVAAQLDVDVVALHPGQFGADHVGVVGLLGFHDGHPPLGDALAARLEELAQGKPVRVYQQRIGSPPNFGPGPRDRGPCHEVSVIRVGGRGWRRVCIRRVKAKAHWVP